MHDHLMAQLLRRRPCARKNGSTRAHPKSKPRPHAPRKPNRLTDPTHHVFPAQHERPPRSRALEPDRRGVAPHARPSARTRHPWLRPLAVRTRRSQQRRDRERGPCRFSRISRPQAWIEFFHVLDDRLRARSAAVLAARRALCGRAERGTTWSTSARRVEPPRQELLRRLSRCIGRHRVASSRCGARCCEALRSATRARRGRGRLPASARLVVQRRLFADGAGRLALECGAARKDHPP